MNILEKEDNFSDINVSENNDLALRKAGFSYFKPHVCDFIKIVHIFSDSGSMDDISNTDLSFTQKELALFATKESIRLSEAQESHLKMEYVDYIYVNLVGLF